MATHFTGPVLNRERVDGLRSWFSNLPVGSMSEPSLVQYFNDFLFANDYDASSWVVTETDSNATEAIAADVVGGALLLTNTAADNDVVQLQSAEEWYKMAVGKRSWYEIKFKVSNATQCDIYVGFGTTDTSIVAGTTDFVGFTKADDSTTFQSITELAASATTNTLLTLADDTYVTVGFYWDGISRVYFYNNRSLVNTHTATLPTTNGLAMTACLQNGNGVARTMTIDYIFAAMER